MKRWSVILLGPIADLFFAVFDMHLRGTPRVNNMKLYGIDCLQEKNKTELQRYLLIEKDESLQNIRVAKGWNTYNQLSQEAVKVLPQF